jgi:hypothetical protein
VVYSIIGITKIKDVEAEKKTGHAVPEKKFWVS